MQIAFRKVRLPGEILLKTLGILVGCSNVDGEPGRGKLTNIPKVLGGEGVFPRSCLTVRTFGIVAVPISLHRLAGWKACPTDQVALESEITFENRYTHRQRYGNYGFPTTIFSYPVRSKGDSEVQKGVIKRVITVADFVRDIRAGKTDTELMDQYHLDAIGLDNAFSKMVRIKAISQRELDARIPELDHPTEIRTVRELPRSYALFSLPVYDADNLGAQGIVNDLHERGLQIEGIHARPGEVKTLLIRVDEFPGISPFAFHAECRWFRDADEHSDCMAGFEISDISPAGAVELRKLIEALSF